MIQTTVRGFPAAFARADTPAAGQVQDMLVVGAVDSTGLRYPLGDTDVAALLPSVYAPGMNVHCANAYTGGTRLTTGTSVGTFSSSIFCARLTLHMRRIYSMLWFSQQANAVVS
jgi:hypothetical protein